MLIQNKSTGIARCMVVVTAALLALCGNAKAQHATTVDVTLAPSVSSKSVTGRLLVFFSKRNRKPIAGPNWFQPEPFFAIDVIDLKPGETITIDDSADSFPKPISKIAAGEYYVQAILDHDFYFSNHAVGPGNFYSKSSKSNIGQGKVNLNLDQVIKAPKLVDTKFVKFVELKSKLLQEYHGREVVERAMVVLPPSYFSNPKRRFPVYYVITGFGGTLNQLQHRWSNGQSPANEGETEFIRVYLTGQCKWGHHVYANSATNGPRGDSFVQEMIPNIDKRFRTIGKPTARFVGGHSSGGWSSLWLQVNYPDSFGGVWSTAPDPVDFRDWQGTDLYSQSANVYFDENGDKRPLARMGNRVVVQYLDFTRMDDAQGRGGQIRSFDAVFSPTDKNGQPAYCWDRESGTVNPDVLEHWQRFDISLILKDNWTVLEPKLKSKLHIYMGDADTFYLEGATKKLSERLKDLRSDAVVEIFEGKDHGNLLTPALRRRILQEMSETFWQHHDDRNNT